MTSEQVSNDVFNVPNVLSTIRLVMAFVVFALIPLHYYQAACVLFIIAASTDWIDGWWARKFKQVTQLGRILDPFCDKIIICGSFILLAVEMREFPWYYQIAGWMAVVVVGREILVTALRSFIESSGGDFSAKFVAKLKMLFQCFAVGGALIALAYVTNAESTIDEQVPTWLRIALSASIWLAMFTTVYSGGEYVLAAARFIRKAAQPDEAS